MSQKLSLRAPAPIELNNRRELFIDDHLISEMKQTQLLVHQPVREEIVAECDAPWEGNGCGYYSVLFDAKDSVYRMYYHAWQIPTGVKGEEPELPAHDRLPPEPRRDRVGATEPGPL